MDGETPKNKYKSWDERYEELAAYKAKYGTFDGLSTKDPGLYAWSYSQQRKTTLSSEQQSKLEALVGTNERARAIQQPKSWDERYAELTAYKAKYGTFRGLKRENCSLYHWTYKQQYSGTLSTEKQNKMEAIGFSSEHDREWKVQYDRLVDFKKANGHCRVTGKADKSLARWVQTQRYQKNKNDMKEERLLLLNRIGFEWGGAQAKSTEERWMAHYQKLVAFKKVNGHLRVPSSDTSLATWVNNQRSRKKGMKEERVTLLNHIGFVWDSQRGNPQSSNEPTVTDSMPKPNKTEKKWKAQYDQLVEKQWKAQYDQLVAFHKAHGHSNVPTKHKYLYNWTRTQRHRKHSGKLQEYEELQLNRIGFAWGEKPATPENGKCVVHWKARYDQLVAFQKTNGHCRFQTKDSKLNVWMSKQRKSKRNGNLKKKRELLLNQIGFVWEPRSLSSKQSSTAAAAAAAAAGQTLQSQTQSPEQPPPKPETRNNSVGGPAVASHPPATDAWAGKVAISYNDEEPEEEDEQFDDADEALLHAQEFHVNEDKRGCMLDADIDEATRVEQQMSARMKRSRPRSPLGEESFGWHQSDEAEERPSPKRPKYNDYDEFENKESSAAYFARKRTPFDTFSI